MSAHRESGFPLTIVRPSHTYDDANPPLPGGWTAVDRIARGAAIPVHGDGTSLWTLTHAEDFARGLVGLLGNPRAIGEVFNITGSDVYSWDQIYSIVAGALGVEPTLVHVASEMYPLIAPDWFWSGEMIDDIGHSAVFDTRKIRTFVPSFDPGSPSTGPPTAWSNGAGGIRSPRVPTLKRRRCSTVSSRDIARPG